MIQDTGGKRFRRKAATALTEINVTPFVDVMLVLLIIFIVTAPMLTSGVSVDLPKHDAGALEVREENVVSVRGDGALFYNDKRLTLRELTGVLKTLAAASPQAEVFLMADKKLSYEAVMRVMGAIRQAGVTRLGLVTEVPGAEASKRGA
ncbi:MAG: ExbD/TolR family protein [Nitrospinae bacterium]|nr:ExbD/TolR family protein [Nitrospinota bacterium]